MARYNRSATTTVSSVSIGLKIVNNDTTLATGATYEIFAKDQPIWININGGTAAASGANCIFIPANSFVEVVAGATVINAIRGSGSDSTVILAELN